MPDDIKRSGEVKFDAKQQITKNSFQQQTSRKVGFNKIMNEMVQTVSATSEKYNGSKLCKENEVCDENNIQ